jgi:outer membrane protein assembly factor BamB
MHGYGSSPVLHKGLVIVQGDSNGPGWLAAVNGETGKIHWRVQRGDGANFCTPLVAHVAGKPQLLLHGQGKVVSYNPDSGDQLWDAEGPATYCANTMCASGNLVFASGGYPERNVLAIKADGSGQVVWRKSIKCYVPSMLVDDDRLIVPQDDGVLHCLEAATGKEIWTKRVGGDLTSSPVLANGHLFVSTESGKTAIFQSSRRGTKVRENENGEACYATPTFCGGEIFVRTRTKLICVGGKSGNEGKP